MGILTRAALAAVCVFTCTGLASAEPTLTSTPELTIGDPPALRITGLDPATEYSLFVSLTDTAGRDWRAETPITGSAKVEVTNANPLLATLTLVEAPDNTTASRDFNEIEFSLLDDGDKVATSTTRQWVFPPTVKRDALEGDLVGELFYTEGANDAPGVIFLGGSGGGMAWAQRSAALLAEQGFVALAVAYFNAEGLPSDLVEVPVEYVDAAIDTLKAHARVDADRIGLVGYSKGAELALLMATRRDDVRALVAFAPGSAVFQGFRRPDFPVISSWSEYGEGLPFVPNAYDDRFFETFDGMYLWYRTLRQHEAFDKAAIPVERIAGDILLVSGVDDTIWPATFMAEQVIARLKLNDFEHSATHLAYPNAGHGIAAPPGGPLKSVAERLGGTVAGNEQARADAWPAIVEFLSATLER